MLKLPYSTLRAAWPALRNPANLNKETPLTPEQFHWCFTNALSREESDSVYERYYIPGRARPFFQAGSCELQPECQTKVDYKNPARAPLLLVTGTEDRICPPSVNMSNFKQQRKAPSATEHKEYPGRSHWPGPGRLGGARRLHAQLDDRARAIARGTACRGGPGRGVHPAELDRLERPVVVR